MGRRVFCVRGGVDRRGGVCVCGGEVCALWLGVGRGWGGGGDEITNPHTHIPGSVISWCGGMKSQTRGDFMVWGGGGSNKKTAHLFAGAGALLGGGDEIRNPGGFQSVARKSAVERKSVPLGGARVSKHNKRPSRCVAFVQARTMALHRW